MQVVSSERSTSRTSVVPDDSAASSNTHTFNFAQASDLAVGCGAAIRVQNSEELAINIQNLLADPSRLEKTGQAGLNFVNSHQGATERALLLIQQYLTE